MKMSTGSLVGIVGGVLVIMGVILPWWSGSNGVSTVSFSGLDTGANTFGYIMIVFGLLGLVMVAPGKRGLAIGSIVFGVLAMLLYLMVIAILGLINWTSGLSGTITTSTGYGLYIGFIGSILLIVGAVMARSAAKKAAAAPVAPPAPPMAP